MTKEELKQLIDSEIDTNGQRRITGAKLNQVLKAIVDNLCGVFSSSDAGKYLYIGSDGQPVASNVLETNSLFPDIVRAKNIYTKMITCDEITSEGNIKTMNGDVKVENGEITCAGNMDVAGNITVAGDVTSEGSVSSTRTLEAEGHGLYLYEHGDRYLVSVNHGNLVCNQS